MSPGLTAAGCESAVTMSHGLDMLPVPLGLPFGATYQLLPLPADGCVAAATFSVTFTVAGELFALALLIVTIFE